MLVIFWVVLVICTFVLTNRYNRSSFHGLISILIPIWILVVLCLGKNKSDNTKEKPLYDQNGCQIGVLITNAKGEVIDKKIF